MSKEPKFGGSGSTFDRCTREVGDEFQPIYKQGSISLKLDDIIKSLCKVVRIPCNISQAIVRNSKDVCLCVCRDAINKIF